MPAAAVPPWHEPVADSAQPVEPRLRAVGSGEIPTGVWRGDELGSAISETCATGWSELDAELPGGGWPLRSLTEVLAPQPAVLEWRLIGRAIGRIAASGGEVVLVGPPKEPHLPGLVHEGLDQRRLIWIEAASPAERLWVTEQMVKSNAAGAIVAWLPQARPEQVRRLQVCAQTCDAPVFLCRPEAARHEASAAPLRLHAAYVVDWELRVEVFKRRGPAHAGSLHLPSVPGGLAAILTPRLLKPGRLFRSETVDVVGSIAPRPRSVRQLAVH